jgi:predicted SnoaL-like aldol condensation-catalyzing enzyme
VIESEVRFRKDTEECLWRAVDIFRIAGDRIVEHTQYCSGVWTPEQIARQAAEAPMVRW